MLLDTDFLVDILRKKKEALVKLEEFLQSPDNLYITHINLCELYKGAYKSEKVHKNLADIDQLLNFVDVLPFTKTADQQFGKLYTDLEKKGELIGEMDVLIASIALDHGVAIVTGNEDHYRKTGVAIVNYRN